MASPPTHDITAPIEYISANDPAWATGPDGETLWVTEIGPLEGEELEDHPLRKYYSGRTRFDLDAPGKVTIGDEVVEKSPRDYLDPAKTPVIYQGQRMKVSENTRCRDLPPAQRDELSFRFACKVITGVEGLSYNPPKKGPAQDVHLEEVANYLGVEVIYEVGKAFLRASSGPAYAEKKRSA